MVHTSPRSVEVVSVFYPHITVTTILTLRTALLHPLRLQHWMDPQGLRELSGYTDRTELYSRARVLRISWSGWRVGEGGCTYSRRCVREFSFARFTLVQVRKRTRVSF